MRWGAALLAAGLAATLALGAGLGGGADPVALASRLIARPLGISPPDLDDPARIRRGGRHYAQFCAACHAAPGEGPRTVGRALRPPAPMLHRRIGGWPDALLFTTVRDGVPDSGMPGWPAPAREDEVWDMVAFLRLLPELDRGRYEVLTGAADGADLSGPVRGCVRCHGPRGRGGEGIPRLDIQSPDYLFDALQAFRAGERASGVMQVAVQGLDDDTLARLAREFGTAAVPPTSGREDPPALVTRGSPDRKIPPCAACHGTSVPARPDFPVLAGQDRRYLALQLRLFAAEEAQRGGGPFSPLMQIAGHNLGPEEIAQAAGWYGAPR
jgi:cytochrome c553